MRHRRATAAAGRRSSARNAAGRRTACPDARHRGNAATRRAAAPAPPPASVPVAPPVATPPAVIAASVSTAPLDLVALKDRLRATKAIGVFTKLSLKNKVDDLMKQFAAHYQAKRPPIAELRLSYDLLIMKVLTLLQDDDQPLASAIVFSREAIWALLADDQTHRAIRPIARRARAPRRAGVCAG
jgi:hypothetical protein